MKNKLSNVKKIAVTLFICTTVSLILCLVLKSWLLALLGVAFGVVTKLVIDGDIESEREVKNNEPFPKEQKKALENIRKSKEKMGV